ncbi:MAG: 2-dehydropantoate 2-reductase [Proteobacteria bacterium]|nr:2-dehydropantoate 2-reductase [Pseudomonadota bacterium]
MKICIFGAGAVGCHFAARLAAIGEDVSCVARGAQLQAIRANGITLHRADQPTMNERVTASDDAASLGIQDVVIVTVKGYALAGAVDGIKALLGPETPVIFAMNGILWWYFYGLDPKGRERQIECLDPGGRLWKEIGPERTLGGVIYSANMMEAPGIVRGTSPGRNWLCIGEPDGSDSERVKKIQAVFEKADMGPIAKDIRRTLWDKLMSNMATGPISCLTGSTVADIQQTPALHDLATTMMRESMAIARALGTDIDIDPVERFEKTKGGSHKVSMLQDMEKGNPMEIDAMVGVPHELAKAAGVDTPALDIMVALLKQRARTMGLYGG